MHATHTHRHTHTHARARAHVCILLRWWGHQICINTYAATFPSSCSSVRLLQLGEPTPTQSPVSPRAPQRERRRGWSWRLARPLMHWPEACLYRSVYCVCTTECLQRLLYHCVSMLYYVQILSITLTPETRQQYCHVTHDSMYKAAHIIIY